MKLTRRSLCWKQKFDDLTGFDAASELADHPKAEAAGEQQPRDSVPAEPSIEQPLDPHALQGATEADAMEGTPRAGACEVKSAIQHTPHQLMVTTMVSP